jgi:hypothetical protein
VKPVTEDEKPAPEGTQPAAPVPSQDNALFEVLQGVVAPLRFRPRSYQQRVRFVGTLATYAVHCDLEVFKRKHRTLRSRTRTLAR